MKIVNKPSGKIDGSNLKITIIVPNFNKELCEEFLKNTKEELFKNGVNEANISVTRVEGALETPFAAQKIIERDHPDAVIALGVVIRGETKHFDLVVETTHQGLMKVQLENRTPIAFGILACENLKQAEERISKKGLNKGAEAATAALIQTTI